MMPAEMIEKAKTVIDPTRGEAYVFAPVNHADKLRESAPALARVLVRSEVAYAAKDYERLDQAAIAARDQFKSTAKRANYAILLASCLGTAIVLFGAFFPEDSPGAVADPAGGKPASASAGSPRMKWVFGGFMVCSILTGALARVWLSEIKRKNLLEEFKQKRATAEAARANYFQQVTAAEGPGADTTTVPDVPLALLQLEYFRKHQLDVQIDYYLDRIKEHRKAAGRRIDVDIWSAGAVSGIAALASFLGTAIGPRWATLASLGAVGSAVSVFATTSEAIHRDRANSRRYGNAVDALQKLRTRLDAVRQSAATGERAPLLEFVAAVNDQIGREHAEWLSSFAQVEEELHTLDEALANVGAPRNPVEKNTAAPAPRAEGR